MLNTRVMTHDKTYLLSVESFLELPRAPLRTMWGQLRESLPGSFSHRHLPFKPQLTSEWSLDFKGLVERFTDFSGKSQFTNFSRAFDIFEKVNFSSLYISFSPGNHFSINLSGKILLDMLCIIFKFF